MGKTVYQDCHQNNRNNSKDSRSPMVGALERKMIKGHVRCVVFPLSKARILGK